MAILRWACTWLSLLVGFTSFSQAKAMEIHVENRPEMLLANNGVPVVYATGEIKPDSAKQLEALLSGNPELHGTLILLNSHGGNLGAGLEMGRLIRKYDLATSIGNNSLDLSSRSEAFCYSACAYAYLGGRFRYFSEGASYGVHPFSFGNDDIGSVSGTQAVAGVIVEYLAEMEIDPRLFSAATRADTNQMVRFSRSDMFDWGLANNGVLPLIAEYRVEQGYPYLALEQKFRWGTGKLLLICGQERNGNGVIQTFVLVGAAQAESIMERAENSYIELDQQKFSEQLETIGTHIQHDALTTVRGFHPGFLQEIGVAESIGLWYDDGNQLHRYGFEMRLESARIIIGDFSRNCNR